MDQTMQEWVRGPVVRGSWSVYGSILRTTADGSRTTLHTSGKMRLHINVAEDPSPVKTLSMKHIVNVFAP